MGFIEKLDALLKESKINKNILSRETGIPYTTIDSFYKKGADNIKLSNLKKIAEYFNVSLDYLVDDNNDLNYEHKITHSTNNDIYYIQEEAAEYAQEIASNKELKMLFDASRNVSKEDLEFVVEMVKKLKRN